MITRNPGENTGKWVPVDIHSMGAGNGPQPDKHLVRKTQGVGIWMAFRQARVRPQTQPDRRTVIIIVAAIRRKCSRISIRTGTGAWTFRSSKPRKRTGKARIRRK